MLISLVALVDELDTGSATELAEIVSRSPNLSDVDSDDLKARLEELLRTSSVSLLTRGQELLFERDNVFTGARVVSDIRHLFARDGAERIDGAVVIHSLRIRKRGADKPTTIALDVADLEQLRAAVDRALAKEVALRSQIVSGGTPLILPFPASDDR